LASRAEIARVRRRVYGSVVAFISENSFAEDLARSLESRPGPTDALGRCGGAPVAVVGSFHRFTKNSDKIGGLSINVFLECAFPERTSVGRRRAGHPARSLRRAQGGEARTPIAHRTQPAVPIQMAPSARLPPRASSGVRQFAGPKTSEHRGDPN
jgi:hypothetical protein